MLSPEDPAVGGTTPPEEPATADQDVRGAPHRRGPRVAIAVLAFLLVAAVVVGAVLVTRLQQRNDEWQASSSGWQDLAHDAATQEASARAELAQRDADLAAAKKQLTTAKARITELADEKAQLADKDAGRQQQLDYQSRVSQAAADVTSALDKCVDGQEQLIAYLDDASRYDADDLARYRSGVSSVCGAATDASDALQRALDAG